MDLQNLRWNFPFGFKALFGLIHFAEVVVAESADELRGLINEFSAKLIERCRESETEFEASSNSARVRGLLRQGGFKPAGRNRPSNEYLLRELTETGNFQFILNLVDINNFLSLKYGLPMSVLDAGKFVGVPLLRLGGVGESYVFNPSGQEIDLEGLIVVADERTVSPGGTESIPMGSPVKDSMLGKISRATRSALCVVYAPNETRFTQVMDAILDEWVSLSEKYASAKTAGRKVLAL